MAVATYTYTYDAGSPFTRATPPVVGTGAAGTVRVVIIGCSLLGWMVRVPAGRGYAGRASTHFAGSSDLQPQPREPNASGDLVRS
jgi:hypothetical protein